MSPAPAHRVDATVSVWWLEEASLKTLVAALQRDGARARFVGGCVRNALIGGGATDLDIAIDRPPEETKRLLEQADLPAHPTGVDHGTYTTVVETIEGHTPIEITSLRRDVETDGRRAVVAFTEDWAEDAARRDFTMNALYADIDGVIYDPLGEGLPDLQARRLHFIGDAETRIREDALRILRYFRFAAWYAVPPEDLPAGTPAADRLRAALDAEDLASVSRLIDLIDSLARERIGVETKKLLNAPDPSLSIALAIDCGAMAHAFGAALTGELAAQSMADAIARLVSAERALCLAPEPLRRLGLFADVVDLTRLTDPLRLSRAETTALTAFAAATTLLEGGGADEAAYRHGAAAARDAMLTRAARQGRDAPDAEAFDRLEWAAAQTLPVTAKDLISKGLRPGPKLGEALREREARWIASGFALDRAALLSEIQAD